MRKDRIKSEVATRKSINSSTTLTLFIRLYFQAGYNDRQENQLWTTGHERKIDKLQEESRNGTNRQYQSFNFPTSTDKSSTSPALHDHQQCASRGLNSSGSRGSEKWNNYWGKWPIMLICTSNTARGILFQLFL